MTTITREFTKEQLISRADHLLCVGKAFIAEHPVYDGMAKDVELFVIALASLTAEPVAWTEKCEITNMQATGLYLRGFPNNSQGRDIALYAAPPTPDDGHIKFEEWMLKKWGRERQEYDFVKGKFLQGENYADSYTRHMWNAWTASRAAMLQGSQPVSNRDELLPSIKPAPELDSVAKNAKSLPSKSPVIPDCWCHTCRPVTMGDMRFVVCPECGNKRCPHANDHRNACTGSNEPGQEGSAYPAAPQQGV